MEWLEYFLKIIYQPIFAGFIYIVVKGKTIQEKELIVSFGSNHQRAFMSRNHRIGLFLIVFLGVFEGIYSVICGPENVFLADREYYAIRFARGTYSSASSLGIYYLTFILNKISYNPYVFFFVAGWLFLIITLIAYNESDDSTPLFFGLLCVSQYLMYGCYQIKQSFAIALSGLAIVILLKERKKVLPGLLIALAIYFHEVAWIMIPIFVVIIFSDKKLVKYSMYLILIVMMLGFRDISRIAVSYISRYIPSLSMQMVQYIDETGSIETGNSSILIILKGAPFYWVFIYSLFKRNDLKPQIANFDAYFLITVIISATSLLSAINAWIWRFGELLYIPLFAFICQINDKLESDRDKKTFKYITLVLFAIFTYRKLLICYFNYGGIV